MTKEINKLIGAELDYAVSIANGETPNKTAQIFAGMNQVRTRVEKGAEVFEPRKYSTDWSLGGPILDKAGIEFTLQDEEPDLWWAEIGRCTKGGSHGVYGPTHLIAGMRCYAMSKLGTSIEIPDAVS